MKTKFYTFVALLATTFAGIIPAMANIQALLLIQF